MGLTKRHDSGLVTYLKGARYWYVALVTLVVCVAVAGFGDAGRDVLKYDRLAIADGEYWRLVTCHFTHLGVSHLLLNLAGLVLVWLLAGRHYSSLQWSLVTLISVAGVSLGFWFIDQNMLWYVGLSGVLHGLLLAGAIAGLRSLPGESAVICGLVIAKLAWEQLMGPLPGSESVSGGNVIVNAHLYGAISGVIAAALLWHRVRPAASI